MPYPSPPPWFDHSNNIWRLIQIMKLFIAKFSPAISYFVPLQSKYPTQQPILKLSQSKLFP
jgi:hypothetical protein